MLRLWLDLLMSQIPTGAFCPGTGHGSNRQNGCKKVIWFMTLRGSEDQSYNDYVKAALISAKQRAPSLLPHLLWFGAPSPMTAWFELHGGPVIFKDLSFYSSLPEHYRGPWCGTYLRYELPDVMASLPLNDDVDHQYVLYTDADVMFYQDITSCSLEKPAVLAMGPEFERNKIKNAGVLYINMTAFAEDKQDLVRFGIEKGFEYFTGSQQLLLDYFGSRISLLPDAYNWKGYWGNPRSDEASVAILHWHGPKPLGAQRWNISTAGGLSCFLNYPLDITRMCSHVLFKVPRGVRNDI